MKIFNWVQKRLSHNVLKDGLTANVKKTESIAIDGNTKMLMEQVAFADLLDGWKQGVLTIGTFGFDVLTPELSEKTEYSFSEADEVEICEVEEEDNDGEKEELMKFGDFGGNENNGEETGQDADKEIAMTPPMMEFSANTEIEIEFESDEKVRITLADLFSEDPVPHLNTKPNSKELYEKEMGKEKSGNPSFAKKFISAPRKEFRSVRKMKKVISKMLKKKIHPDMEGPKGSISENYPNKFGAAESESLLQV